MCTRKTYSHGYTRSVYTVYWQSGRKIEWIQFLSWFADFITPLRVVGGRISDRFVHFHQPIQLKLEEGFFRLYARSRRVRRKESRLKLRRVEKEGSNEGRKGMEGRWGEEGEGDMLRVRVRARGVDVSRVVKLDKRNWRERFDEQKGRMKRGGERVLMKWHRHSFLFIRREIRRRLYSHHFEITSRILFFSRYIMLLLLLEIRF